MSFCMVGLCRDTHVWTVVFAMGYTCLCVQAGAPPLAADEHGVEIRLRTDKGPGKRSDHDDFAALQSDHDIRHPLLAPSPSRPTLAPISPSIPIDPTPFSFLDSRPRGRASDGGESLRRSSSSSGMCPDDSLGGRLSSRRSESWRWDEIKWSEGQSRSGGQSVVEGEEDSRGSEEGEGSGSSGYGYLVIRSEAESEESDSSAGSSVVTARRISPSPENPDNNEVGMHRAGLCEWMICLCVCLSVCL